MFLMEYWFQPSEFSSFSELPSPDRLLLDKPPTKVESSSNTYIQFSLLATITFHPSFAAFGT